MITPLLETTLELDHGIVILQSDDPQSELSLLGLFELDPEIRTGS